MEDLIHKLKGIFFVHCSLSAVEDYVLVDMSWGFCDSRSKGVSLVGWVVVFGVFNRRGRSKRRRYH